MTDARLSLVFEIDNHLGGHGVSTSPGKRDPLYLARVCLQLRTFSVLPACPGTAGGCRVDPVLGANISLNPANTSICRQGFMDGWMKWMMLRVRDTL